jgi:hypothetical protein
MARIIKPVMNKRDSGWDGDHDWDRWGSRRWRSRRWDDRCWDWCK